MSVVTAGVRAFVRARRALRGPMRPSWDEGFETLATFLHLYGKHQFRLSVATQRRSMGGFTGARPPPGLRYEPVDAGGVRAEWFVPEGADPTRAIYYLHGGGYCLGSIDTHRDALGRLARMAGLRILVPDYRLAPEHKFPAQLEDAVAAYKFLLSSGVDASRVVVAGESAGAGLSLSLLVALRDGDAGALPAAAVCLSPWVDLEVRGATMEPNAKWDYVTTQTLRVYSSWYAPGLARDPRVAALHADLRGLPPLLVMAGEAETLLDDAQRLSQVARGHGVSVTFEVERDMIHAWPIFAWAGFRSSEKGLERIAAYARMHLGLGGLAGEGLERPLKSA
jgi:acetyl esterase/lipase